MFWQDGWCQSDEIDLDPVTFACATFHEAADDADSELLADDDDELDWDDDESLIEDELDERLYEVTRPSLLDDDDADEDDEPNLEDEFELIDEDMGGW